MGKTHKKCIFTPFLSLHRQADNHIGWTTSMPFSSIDHTHPMTHPRNVQEKYWELAELENWHFFCFLLLDLGIFINIFPSVKISLAFIICMRYHLFLHNEWFLQNLGKDFIWTNMHKTVLIIKIVESLTCIFFFRDTGISLQIQMYQLYSEIFVFFTYLFLVVLLTFLNPYRQQINKFFAGRVIQSVVHFIIYVVQPLFYLHGDQSFRKNCINQGIWHALKKEIFRRA